MSAKEVAKLVGFLFDKELTKRLDGVLASFSSENPTPELGFFITSDNVFF
jgi:hypothetical protein